MTPFVFIFLNLLNVLAQATPYEGANQVLESASPLRNVRNSTDDLIAYLNILIEHGILGEAELKRFVRGLEEKKLVNPLTIEQAAVSSLHLIHREELQNYIDFEPTAQSQDSHYNQVKILRWTRNALRELIQKKLRQMGISEDTAELFLKMKFNPVAAGSFKMGLPRAEIPGFPPPATTVEVELTHSYEMTASPVTQQQWFNLMNANPSQFNTGADQMNLQSKENRNETILGQPDHPVESITWWSGLILANRLSEKMGYIPAYDVSEMTFAGDAAQGTLQRISGQLKINGLQGNIYAAQGYRYPTEAEFEFVLKKRGTTVNVFPYGETREEIDQFIWHRLNSGSRTQAVGGRKAFIVDGYAYHDLIGNVGIFTQDGYSLSSSKSPQVLAKVDPFLPLAAELQDTELSLRLWKATEVVVRGGFYDFWPTDYATRYDRHYLPIQNCSPGVGMRLVRTTEHTVKELIYLGDRF